MALTLSNSNYNGEVLETLYTVLGVGNEIGKKGACTFLPSIAKKKSLPKLSRSTRPIGTYTSGAPSTDTVTTTYAERSIDPKNMMVYEEFIPEEFQDVWEAFQSVGDFTNLELNQRLMMAIFDLYADGIGEHMSELFFQGDTGSGTATLAYFNGLITRASADANVVKPTPAGNITAANFFDILAACWLAVPDKFIDDPDFFFAVNTTDYKLMQTANTELKKDFVGVFGQSLETMYQTNKIQHFTGMPQHHIVGYKVNASEARSNAFLGSWVNPDQESVRVDRVSNSSDTWFIRINLKSDMNYRESSEIVLYEPS